MDGAPPRPAQVPEAAVWDDEAGEWRDGIVDAQGARQGLHRSWRADGTPRDESTFVDGKSEGHYRRFHPSGQVAREGDFRGGVLQGTVRAFGSDGPTGEPLQSCCVPPNAWQLHTDYDAGQMVGRRWYDRAGVHIMDNGEPHPPHPASVPVEARYEEGDRQWVIGGFDANFSRTGRWRRWSTEGVLLDEEELDGGARHGVWRRYRDGDGALRIECGYARGLRSGGFQERGLDPAAYQDARAAAEEGTFERDLAVGVWTLRDAAGQPIATRDLGVAVDDELLSRSPALADGEPPVAASAPDREAAAAFAELSRALAVERRIGESIIAMARSAARAADAAPLHELLSRVVWPRSAVVGRDQAVAAVEAAGDSLAPLVNALVLGGDAPTLLRAMASIVKGAHRAALDLVDAALLLAPDRHECLVTRALIQIHLGHPERAKADAHALPGDWDEQRQMLLDYTRVLFPIFDFWPARTVIETSFQESPAAPDQPPEAIHAVAQKYATRLGLVRAELVRRMGGEEQARGATWLPPELGALLPGGPAPLRAWRFQQTFEAEEPGAPDVEEEIAVDETPPLANQSIPGLLRVARGDWAALCWLCWSAGLDQVTLPGSIAPPADFGPAAGMSVERTWRCRDKLNSGGLVAMSKGVPGFEWEGMHIDLMPRLLAEIVTEEIVETRALFCWLCDASAESPWQSDLREGV